DGTDPIVSLYHALVAWGSQWGLSDPWCYNAALTTLGWWCCTGEATDDWRVVPDSQRSRQPADAEFPLFGSDPVVTTRDGMLTTERASLKSPFFFEFPPW